METPMATFTRRRTPYGYTTVEYDGELYLEGDALSALETALNNANVRFAVKDSGPGRYLVEFDYGEDPPFDLVESAPHSATPTVEGALRYALGAHFGSWEDPVIEEGI